MKLIHIILVIFLILGNAIMFIVSAKYDTLLGITALVPWLVWIIIMERLDKFASTRKQK